MAGRSDARASFASVGSQEGDDMFGWSERRDQGSSRADTAVLFGILESPESHVVEEVKSLIHENLNNTRDAWFVHELVDYYISTKSSRCLEILVQIREPHDKHLFDKLHDCLKLTTTRYQALLVLGHVVRRNPSWLHKIVQHRVMQTLLHILKNDVNAPNLMSGLLTVVSLLPMIPALVGPFLSDIFDIFSRLVAWNVKKPASVPEIYILHLQVGVYSLFHRLYAMYPCNFLAYLRSYYGRFYNQESMTVFFDAIKPMLERVRLHPALVTASKETELQKSRWKKMETHDIIVECAKVSLDAIEGIQEDCVWNSKGRISTIRYLHNWPPFIPSQEGSQSSSLSITMEAGSVVSDAVNAHDPYWTPTSVCGFNTPPPGKSSSFSFEMEPPKTGTRYSLSPHPPVQDEALPLDVAVEAKPEDTDPTSMETPKSRVFNENVTSVSRQTSKEAAIKVICSPAENTAKTSGTMLPSSQETSVHSTLEQSNLEVQPNVKNDTTLGGIAQAEEAKEEDIVDREVSELTSTPLSTEVGVSRSEEGDDTPFCSTTQKLTDEPGSLSVLKDDYQEEIENEEEIDNSIHDGDSQTTMQSLMKSIKRLRYFSQCRDSGSSKESVEIQQKRRVRKRSQSCPDIKSLQNVPLDAGIKQQEQLSCGSVQQEAQVNKNLSTEVNDVPSTAPVTVASSSFTKGPNEGGWSQTRETSTITPEAAELPPYSHLFPLALAPNPVPPGFCAQEDFQYDNFPVIQPASVKNTSQQSCMNLPVEVPFFTTLSPAELLDRHLQLGNEVYISQLNSIPLTSSKNTDWTHFGGNPPADEVAILRNQILLLHNQLLFERHKRQTHAERNRRLLGKAKRTRMFEEQYAAMKDQLQLQEKGNQDLVSEVKKLSKEIHHLNIDRECRSRDLQDQMKSLTQENNNLNFSNKKLQGLLVQQKHENDTLRKELAESQAQLLEVQMELEVASKQMIASKKMEKELSTLAKELILVQELNRHYKERIEMLKLKSTPEIDVMLIQEAAENDIKGLRQQLEVKTVHLEACKGKISELEAAVAKNNTKNDEQKRLMDSIKNHYDNELQAKEDRLVALKKINQQQETHILELYHKLETQALKYSGVHLHAEPPQSSSLS